MSKPYAHPMLEPLNYDFDPKLAAEVYSGDMLKIYSLLWNAAVAALVEGPVVRNHLISLELTCSIFIVAQWTEIIETGWYEFLPQSALKQNHEKLFFDNANEAITNLVPTYNPELLQTTQQIQNIANKIFFASPLDWVVNVKALDAMIFGYAELIEHMTERKVGRPSTYASAIETALKNKLIIDKGANLSLDLQGKHFLSLINQQPAELQINSVFCTALEKDLSLVEQDPNRAGEILNKYCQQFFQKTTELASWLDNLLVEGKMLKELTERQVGVKLPAAKKQEANSLVKIITEDNSLIGKPLV